MFVSNVHLDNIGRKLNCISIIKMHSSGDIQKIHHEAEWNEHVRRYIK